MGDVRLLLGLAHLIHRTTDGAPAQVDLCGSPVLLARARTVSNRQWKKCRVPVKYMVTPAFFAASMLSSSRIEPPG